MVGATSGNGGHYNPDEPRDWHGRWTSGGSSGSASAKAKPIHFGHGENPPLDDLSAVGRATGLLVHTGVQLKGAHGFSRRQPEDRRTLRPGAGGLERRLQARPRCVSRPLS